MSGIFYNICNELLKRGLLYGAVDPNAVNRRHFSGPKRYYLLERKIKRTLDSVTSKIKLDHRRSKWEAESEGRWVKYCATAPQEQK